LQVEEYERETPYQDVTVKPPVVRVKMKQHAGEAAAPAVKEGQKVKQGQAVGRVAAGKLGADVHASMDGRVRAVNADFAEIVA